MSIKAILCAILATCSLGYITERASAQVVFTPVVSTPVVVQPAPVVVGSTYTAGYSSSYVAPTYSSLSPVVTTSPVITTSTYSTLSPVVSSAVVTPAPVVTAAPVVSYRPVVTSYTVPYVAARPVVVSPKVYVPGEPVRNFFRAVTP